MNIKTLVQNTSSVQQANRTFDSLDMISKGHFWLELLRMNKSVAHGLHAIDKIKILIPCMYWARTNGFEDYESFVSMAISSFRPQIDDSILNGISSDLNKLGLL